MVKNTLLEIISGNREDLMLSNNMALKILSMIHRNFDKLTDEECIMSLALNDSIARMIFHADYDRAIAISRETLDRFPQSSHTFLVACHLRTIGRSLSLSGRYDIAEQTLLQALAIGEHRVQASDELSRLNADVLHDLAMTNDKSQGEPSVSIAYLQRALDMLKETSYEVRKGVCLMGIGNVKYNEKKLQSALEYYMMASLIFDEQSNFSNLASVDSNIGLCYTGMDMPELADGFLKRSLQLRQRIGNSDEIAISYYNLGSLYERIGKVDKAIIHMLSCRDYAGRSVNKYVYNLALDALERLAQLKGDHLHASPAGNERLRAQFI